MAGGTGSRFWPMSTPECPKQFIDILGTGRTMIQLTIDRFKGIVPIENVWVVTSSKYRDYVFEQVPGIPAEQVLLEPCMRNTAPCIAYVSWKIFAKDPDANLVFSPSDHVVLDVPEFQRVVKMALEESASSSKIITLGMQPVRPETGYGYIKEATHEGAIRKVEAFKEKPDLATAQRYIAEGGYYWNSGLFFWNVRTVLSSFRALKPNIASIFDTLAPSFYTESEQAEVDRLFPQCEGISIDYAIMEHSEAVYTLPASFLWSDIGTWRSLLTHLPKDEAGNGVIGQDVTLKDTHNCIVHVAGEKKVIIEGLDGYIVAEHDDALLIAPLGK